MGTILEALAVIKGKDATGGAFDAVANKIGRIARAANALNRDVQKQLNVAALAERQANRVQRGSFMIGNAAKMAAGAAATYEGSRAMQALASRTAQVAADRAHEQVRMSASGMTPEEIADADDIARKLSAKFKSLSQTEIMHTARNVRAVVGNFEEATKILDPLMKLRVVAEGAHPEHAEELGEDFDKLVKGMEIKGVTQDLAKFNHYIDGMAKALNVFGDTLRPTDYYEMFKYGRAATNALGDDFMLKTAPTLAQELGGSSAGKALSSFYTQFVGGKMSNKAVEALATYGLIDQSKVIKTTTGNIKGVGSGGIVGQEYLQPGATDPYAWVNNVLLPHLAKKGVTDPAQIQEVIAAIASQQTTAQMMSIFATQQSRIQKDAALSSGAKGADAATDYLQHDPKVLQKAIGAQLDNYLGNTAEPFTKTATGGMNWLASGISYMSDRAKKDPLRSAGELGYGAMIAGALGLDSASSFLGAIGNKFRGVSALEGVGFGLTRLTAMLAPVVDIATRRDVLAPSASLKTLAGPHPEQFDALSDLDREDALFPNVREGSWLGQKIAAKKAEHAAERARIEDELTDLGYAGPGVPGRGQMASQWSIDDIRKATGIGSSEPVEAKVVGEATLKTEVTISPSPDFIARIRQEVDNGINAFRSSNAPRAGTSGSTGQSMPEAGPPQ